MTRFLLRWLGIAVATAVAIWALPGIYAVGDNGYKEKAVRAARLAWRMKRAIRFVIGKLNILEHNGRFYAILSA